MNTQEQVMVIAAMTSEVVAKLFANKVVLNWTGGNFHR